jgi:spore coat protein U-like protein
MKNPFRWITALRCLAPMLAALAVPAHAAITCNVTSGGVFAAYDPTAPGNDVNQTSFTVTCTKGAAGDPASVNYSVKVDNGLYSLGVNNRAAFGASRIKYDVFTNVTCGSAWKGGTAITGTVSTPSVGTFTATSTYWGCVQPLQAVPAGTYTDTVTMTMTYGATSSTAVGSFPVSISTPATCSVTAPPGNVVFNYVSFGAAVTPSSTFGVTCTLSLPYTMALDATAGTVVGLNYTLSLATASSTGTGAQQTHTINGSMAAGQAGTCNVGTCSGSQARSVTITY